MRYALTVAPIIAVRARDIERGLRSGARRACADPHRPRDALEDGHPRRCRAKGEGKEARPLEPIPQQGTLPAVRRPSHEPRGAHRMTSSALLDDVADYENSMV